MRRYRKLRTPRLASEKAEDPGNSRCRETNVAGASPPAKARRKWRAEYRRPIARLCDHVRLRLKDSTSTTIFRIVGASHLPHLREKRDRAPFWSSCGGIRGRSSCHMPLESPYMRNMPAAHFRTSVAVPRTQEPKMRRITHVASRKTSILVDYITRVPKANNLMQRLLRDGLSTDNVLTNIRPLTTTTHAP